MVLAKVEAVVAPAARWWLPWPLGDSWAGVVRLWLVCWSGWRCWPSSVLLAGRAEALSAKMFLARST